LYYLRRRGLKVVNATARAYAEKSTVAVISGAPGTKERTKNPLLHHMVRDYETQQRIFEHVTVAPTILNNSRTAAAEIDRVLLIALRHRRPVYIELPRDMVSSPMPEFLASVNYSYEEQIDRMAMAESVEGATYMINSSQMSVIVAGVEIQLFALQSQV
jgi:TPP-dependent 2-oxoacid decarboxylase